MERCELRGHDYHVLKRKYLLFAARRICRTYSVPHVRLAFADLPNCGSYLPGVITLDRASGRNLLNLAHELAHHVVAYRHPHAQDHGPRWMRYYAEVADILRIVPLAGMLALCRKYNLGVAPPLNLTAQSAAAYNNSSP